MSKKFQPSFTKYSIMHGMFGLGLGILIATFIPVLQIPLLGIALMVIAVIWDSMKKK